MHTVDAYEHISNNISPGIAEDGARLLERHRIVEIGFRVRRFGALLMFRVLVHT